MKIITDERCLNYAAPGHPERPARVEKSLEKLRQQTTLALTWGTPAAVEREALLRAHTPDHLTRLDEPGDFDADTPFFPKIAEHALAAVGAGLAALKSARGGEAAFSLIRPPGHHATRNRSMGFCYLSNIAIATLEALVGGCKRVAVYDFDVHHGNGTEAILLNKPGTAVFSIHQFPCYPGTGARNVGDNCHNYPVPPRTPRGDYRRILESAFEQLQKFKPDLVGVSAGFDAYARDPLAQETLEVEDYYWLGQRFRQLSVPVFSLLEGGYSNDLPELIFAYLQGLEGK